ncbi:11427_t:CDS:2, partial [Diversispora eburnea]
YVKGGGGGCGCGEGSSYTSNRIYSSGSGWVFWYYYTDGWRRRENYCIVTLSTTGFLIILILYCNISTKKKSNQIKSKEVKTIIVKLSPEITLAAVIAWNRSLNEYRLETPPAYDNVSLAPVPPHLFD